jgi:hypothetical protein
VGPIKELVSQNGRKWLLSSEIGPPSEGTRWGACLLVSMSDLPFALADSAARAALSARCPAIAIVASNSEAVHDRIDSILEAAEAYEVATTSGYGSEGLEDAIRMIEFGLAGDGPVFAVGHTESIVEEALRRMGYVP